MKIHNERKYIVCEKKRGKPKKAIEICKNCKDNVSCKSYKRHLLLTEGCSMKDTNEVRSILYGLEKI